MPRADDEHMAVPVWRMRQLQDIEDAAREAVELIATTPSHDQHVAGKVKTLLEDALEGRQ
jgi:hypothetical protein